VLVGLILAGLSMHEILVEAVAEVRSVAKSHPQVPQALIDLGLVEL
jgi:hypothetical protein